MDPLAQAGDFVLRGIDSDRWNDAALAAVSAAVREAAGSPIVATTATVTVMGGTAPWLNLPGPVSAVTAVTIDGEAVDATTYTAFPHALYRAAGWGDFPSLVVVTATFGLAATPDDIVQLVVDLTVMASAGGADPTIESEQIDDYRVTYREGVVSAVDLPERTRLMLARRFGGGVTVTGSR